MPRRDPYWQLLHSSKRRGRPSVRIGMALFRVFVAIYVLVGSPAAWAQPGPQGGRGGGAGPQGRPIPPRGVMPTDTPRGTAVIRGIVVAADNGNPVRQAQVRVPLIEVLRTAPLRLLLASGPSLLSSALFYLISTFSLSYGVSTLGTPQPTMLADREGATHCLIVGDTELTGNMVLLKDLATGEQTTHPRDTIVQLLFARQ